LKSVSKAITALHPDGGYIHWNFDEYAVIYNKLSLSKMKFKQPLIIDGYNNTLIYGFEGEYDHENHMMKPTPESEWMPFHAGKLARNWHKTTIMDCHNVVLKRIEGWGGHSNTINLNDSYPEIGLKDILIEKCTFKYGLNRTFFTGGHHVQNITLLDCVFTGTMYGDVTHTVYFSGAQYDPDYPPWANVQVIRCLIEQGGGRHAIQFNGRFKGLIIRGCLIRHGMLACLSMIGVQDAIIENNEFYGSNKQVIVLYDYWWKGYNPNFPLAVQDFCSTHQPNQNITIRRNTIHQTPQWTKYPMHVNDPRNFAPIEFNNAVHSMELKNGKKFFEVYGDIFAPKNFVIKKNAIHSINKDGHLVKFWNEAEGAQTFMHQNLVFSEEKAIPSIAFPWEMVQKYGLGGASLTYLEDLYPDWYGMNTIGEYNPQKAPTFKHIDLFAKPDFNWDSYKSSYNGFSFKAKRLKVGKRYPVAVISETEVDDG
jgi:hypothetical protein